MPVTKAERNRAIRQARETARFERKSAEAATRLGFRIQSKVLRAFRRRDLTEIRPIIETEFRTVTPVMVEAMTIAYLVGLDRIKEVGTRPATVAAALGGVAPPIHTGALKYYYKRLNVDPKRLRDIQGNMEKQAVVMLRRLEDGVNRGVDRAVTRGIQEGLTTREGTALLREEFANRGIVPFNSFEFETQFRTATQLAYSAGTWDAAHDPAVDEILWGYKYVTVGDDRVRPEHAALEDTVAKKDDPIWGAIWPPNGWNCRCQVIYLFEPEKVNLPGPREIDGQVVTGQPDAGWSWNAGTVLSKSDPPREPDAVGKVPVAIKPPWKKAPPPKPEPGTKKMTVAEMDKIASDVESEALKDQIEAKAYERAHPRSDKVREHGYAFDARGNKIFDKVGERAQVSFTEEEFNRIKGARLFTHNHPSGRSLSADDIKVLVRGQLDEMRAAGDQYVYSMKFNKKAIKGLSEAEIDEYIRSLENRIGLRYFEVNRDLMEIGQANIASGRWTIPQAEMWHQDELWKRVVKDFSELRYRRRKR